VRRTRGRREWGGGGSTPMHLVASLRDTPAHISVLRDASDVEPASSHSWNGLCRFCWSGGSFPSNPLMNDSMSALNRARPAAPRCVRRPRTAAPRSMCRACPEAMGCIAWIPPRLQPSRQSACLTT